MKRALTGFAVLLSCAFAAAAQTNEFNYQGSLNSGGTPANGNHDFEFALFDMREGGMRDLGPVPEDVAKGRTATDNDERQKARSRA